MTSMKRNHDHLDEQQNKPKKKLIKEKVSYFKNKNLNLFFKSFLFLRFD